MNVSPKLTFVFSYVLFKIAKSQSCHTFVVVLSNTIHSFIMSVYVSSLARLRTLLSGVSVQRIQCSLYFKTYHMVIMMFCF